MKIFRLLIGVILAIFGLGLFAGATAGMGPVGIIEFGVGEILNTMINVVVGFAGLVGGIFLGIDAFARDYLKVR